MSPWPKISRHDKYELHIIELTRQQVLNYFFLISEGFQIMQKEQDTEKEKEELCRKKTHKRENFQLLSFSMRNV